MVVYEYHIILRISLLCDITIYIITIFRPMRINSIVTRGCTDDKALTVFSPVQNITKQHAIRAVIFLHPRNTLPTPPYLWDHTPPAPIRIAPNHGALCQCFIVRAMRLIVVSISQCSCRPTSPFLPVFLAWCSCNSIC